MNEDQVEERVKELGLNAPRLTPNHIEKAIISEQYYVFPNTTTTVCALKLANGFTVVGKSASVSAANFDKKIGEEVARDDAKQQVWELEGYLLRNSLHLDILKEG
jgi:hypothetical protein